MSVSTEKAEVQAKVEEEMKKIRSMLDLDLTLFCAAILLECFPLVPHVRTSEVLACSHRFPAACWRDRQWP